MQEIIKIHDLKHIYPDGTELNYTGMDFTVGQGERVALVGPNGSGKTTLLYHIIGLLRPVSGFITVFGYNPTSDLWRVRSRIGILLQHADDQIIAPKVRDDIAFSPRNYGFSEREVDEMVDAIIDELSIKYIQNKVPQYLSGGQRTKVALAGALVMKPSLMVMDEPFENLDPLSKSYVVNLINQLRNKRNMAFIISTHDINLIPRIADTVYLLSEGGSFAFKGTPRELFSHPNLLYEHHIELPILMELADRLKRNGFNIGSPMTIEEALSDILTENEKRTEEGGQRTEDRG